MSFMGINIVPLLFFFFLSITTNYDFVDGKRTLGRSGRGHGLVGNNYTSTGTLAPRTPLCSQAESYGYTCQDYQVVTEDGYVLALQRIFKKKPKHGSLNSCDTGPPVLLQHGLVMDGMTWMVTAPQQSLACILADNGYDVWIANTRGTKWSRGHTTLSVDQKEYWEWSWDQIKDYDLQTNVDFIFTTTKQKLFYVGHSQGTLIVMTALSQGKLVNKLRAVGLLTPIAHMDLMTSPLMRITVGFLLDQAAYYLGLAEFNPKSHVADELLQKVCATPGADCYNLLIAMTGPNCCLNVSTVETFLKNEFQPTSTKNLVHFAQMIRFRSLRMYDYQSPVLNMAHYGKFIPPAYNLTNIPPQMPMFLAYGDRDFLADFQDVERLIYSDLSSHPKDKMVVEFVRYYAHLDFVMAANAKEMVYDSLIAFFKNH